MNKLEVLLKCAGDRLATMIRMTDNQSFATLLLLYRNMAGRQEAHRFEDTAVLQDPQCFGTQAQAGGLPQRARQFQFKCDLF